jgi:aminoglycoside 6'-N-acetyltransferase I
MTFKIQRCASVCQPGWLELRQALWPDCPWEEHLAEMVSLLDRRSDCLQILAYSQADRLVGFAEATLRRDYVNGTVTSPVTFLEALYVVPDARRRGAGRKLVEAVESWAREAGCRELASDSLLENESAHLAHRAMGFGETERVVFFNKALR